MIRFSRQPFILICLLLLPYTLASSVVLAESNPTRIVLGTATKGGGFQLFGSHLADVINSVDSR